MTLSMMALSCSSLPSSCAVSSASLTPAIRTSANVPTAANHLCVSTEHIPWTNGLTLKHEKEPKLIMQPTCGVPFEQTVGVKKGRGCDGDTHTR